MRRSFRHEWMDDPAATEADFAAALRDLEFLGRISLGPRPVLAYLDRLVARTGARHLSVLDVGAGGGDMLRAIAAWGARRGITLALTGLDRSPWAEKYARAAGTDAAWLTHDLFDLPAEQTFDVVLCSLFTHHLNDEEMVRFLRWLPDHARLGWMISDLHRHWLPWVALWLGTRALRLAPMVIHDSTISVARSFVRADLTRLIAQAGVAARVRWVFLFRWVIESAA